VLGAALAIALAIPASTLADTTPPPTIYPAASDHATIRLAGGGVVGRLVAQTRVDFTCDPFIVPDETGVPVEVTTGTLEFGTVTILQAAGRTINSGEGAFYGGPVVCDGVTVNHRDVNVAASLLPWKNGSAVAAARVSITGPDWQFADYASTGALAIKLGH
jgi:hypothetical protein